MLKALEYFPNRKYKDIRLFSREHRLPLTWALLSLQPSLLREMMSESNPCKYNKTQLHYTRVQELLLHITVCNNILNYIEITIARELRSKQYQLDRL